MNYDEFLYEPINEGIKDSIENSVKYWHTGKTKAERDELESLDKEEKNLPDRIKKKEAVLKKIENKKDKKLTIQERDRLNDLKRRIRQFEKSGETKKAEILKKDLVKFRKQHAGVRTARMKLRHDVESSKNRVSEVQRRKEEINTTAERRNKKHMAAAGIGGAALVAGGIAAGAHLIKKYGDEVMDKKPFDEAFAQGYYDALNEMENNTNYDIYDDIENEADFDNEYEDAFLEGFYDAMNDIKTNPFPIIGGHDIKGDLLAMYQMGNGPERIAAIKSYLDTGKKITGGLIGGEYGTEGGVFYRKNKFLPGSAVNPEEAAGYLSLYNRLRPQDRKRIMDAYKKSKK